MVPVMNSDTHGVPREHIHRELLQVGPTLSNGRKHIVSFPSRLLRGRFSAVTLGNDFSACTSAERGIAEFGRGDTLRMSGLPTALSLEQVRRQEARSEG